MSLSGKCFAGFLLFVFASLTIAIFGATGAAVLVVLALLAALGFLLKLFAQLAKRVEKRSMARMLPEERDKYLVKQRDAVVGKQQARAALTAQKQRDREARARRREQWDYGAVNPAMICPHCHAKGAVRTKLVENKVGISGGKATAAVLTGGVSLLATGLSRKQRVTAARCGECKSAWQF
jgi:hypothetical protein